MCHEFADQNWLLFYKEGRYIALIYCCLNTLECDHKQLFLVST